ncbi:MAG: YceI family protein [Terriglobia bacterium]
MQGTFRMKSGFIKFDPRTGAAKGLVVDATSGDSGNDGRDQRMHKDILESQLYPEITFAPIHVQGKMEAKPSSPLKASLPCMAHRIR